MFPGNDNNESWVKICCLSTAILCTVVRQISGGIFSSQMVQRVRIHGIVNWIGCKSDHETVLAMLPAVSPWQYLEILLHFTAATVHSVQLSSLFGSFPHKLKFQEMANFTKLKFYLYENYFLKLFLMKFAAVQCQRFYTRDI